MIPAQIIFLSLGVLTFILALAGNLIYTHRELLKKSTINHWHDWKIKAASVLPSITMFCVATENINLWVKLSLSSVLVGVWWWTFFDGFYGLAVAKDFFFTGTATGKNAANSDKVLRSIPKWLHIFLKVGGCAVTLYLYIKICL